MLYNMCPEVFSFRDTRVAVKWRKVFKVTKTWAPRGCRSNRSRTRSSGNRHAFRE